MIKQYSFFEYDNAYYRRDDTNGQIAVNDVWNRTKREWQPHEGDIFKIGMFASRIDDPADDAPPT